MTAPSSAQNPLDALAEEFVSRLRRGDAPDIEEYAARHPDLAADIRDTFPVLVAMERAKPPAGDGPSPPAIPGYTVVGWVGGGGMGDVYEAVQQSLGRRVALKVLRPRGRTTDAYRERFRREARAAGRLHHTHIVPVFDSGEADGVLYYAMQLIPGRGLDAVLDEVRKLPAGRPGSTAGPGSTALTGPAGADYHRAVARVGADAADALAYAHSQGVLHRDVKPSNLLLDDRGEVWVADFGLAKAADAGDLTDTGDVVGTVRYMAPERFDGAADSRSDVYALGLTLYELAALRPAYDGPADAGLVRRIAAGPPPAPRAVAPDVPRDLETVILKATARTPAHRYPTAAALADDLRRFAAGQPVLARRVSATEATWRAAKRNPLVAGLVAAVVLVSVAGAAGSGWYAWRADQRADGERRAKEDADARRAEAEDAAAASREVRTFLQDKLLRQADARMRTLGPAADRNPTVRDLLDRAAGELAPDRLDRSFPGRPLVHAELLFTVGDTYREVGVPGRAVPLLKRAAALREQHLPADHRDTLLANDGLALALVAAGETAEGIKMHERVLAAQTATLGADHPDTRATTNNLAAAHVADFNLPAAVTLLEQLRDTTTGPEADRPDALAVRSNLGYAYLYAGRIPDALKLFERLLADGERVLPAGHPDLANFRNGRGEALRAAGRLPEAAAVFTQVIAECDRDRTPDHPQALLARGNLASVHRGLGQTAKAIELYEQVMKAQTAKFGVDHPDTLNTADGLGQAYLSARRLTDAIPLLERARAARLVKPGPTHPSTLTSTQTLAAAYRMSGRVAEAVGLLEQVRKVQLAEFPADHPHVMATTNSLALAYRDSGRPAEAIALYEALLPLCDKQFGGRNPKTLVTAGNLALTLEAAGRPAAALPYHLRAADGMAAAGFESEHAPNVVRDAIACLERLGLPEAAEARRRKWLPVVKRKAGAESAMYASELAALGQNLLRQRKWTDAESPLRECLAVREKTLPDGWVTFHTRSLLGGALAGQERYTEAESLLLAGYDGLTKRQKTIPPQSRAWLAEAADRLIDLYTATDRPHEAAKWQAERAAYRDAIPPPRPASPSR